MGRGKIEIKKIENASSRQVTFSKRRSGLFKKANELAVLCDADVAVIIFSNTGKLFEYSSCSIKKILARYHKYAGLAQVPATECKPEKQEPKEEDLLKEEIEKLRSKQLQLLGKDLNGMSLAEIRALEKQLNEGLICIKEKKEKLLMEQLAESKMMEQKAMLENETLRRQVEEFREFFPSINHPKPLSIVYPPIQNGVAVIKQGSVSPETACNGGLEDEDDDSDTTLQLGLPSQTSRKRKTPDGETHSSK